MAGASLDIPVRAGVKCANCGALAIRPCAQIPDSPGAYVVVAFPGDEIFHCCAAPAPVIRATMTDPAPAAPAQSPSQV